MRVGMLADAFNMECTPHNWGNPMDLAVHFQLELALPNAFWFEMPYPAEFVDRPYHKDKFRIDKDGYVLAPPRRDWAIPSTATLSTRSPSALTAESDEVAPGPTFAPSPLFSSLLVLCPSCPLRQLHSR